MSDRPVGTRPLVLPLVAAALLAACGTDVTLPPATTPVLEQRITLHALTGTGVQTTSAYNMLVGIDVRTDETTDFDFAFDIGPDSAFGVGTTGSAVGVFLPRGTLGLSADGGLQRTTFAYDSIIRAPLGGYVGDRPMVIDSGNVLFAASRLQTCNFNVIRPVVAKIRVDSLSMTQRAAYLSLTIDPNCGYLSLVPGELPQN